MYWLLSLASADTPPIPRLQWDWSTSQRFMVEAEVQLPVFMWFRAQRNKEVRANGFQVQAVLNCLGTDRIASPRREEVICAIEQMSLSAGIQPGDRGRAGEVLQEYDDVLTGASLELIQRTDTGRVTAIELGGLEARNYRTRVRNETLRQLMRYVAMGFELPLTEGGDHEWVSEASLVCTMPSAAGTSSPVEAVHNGRVRGDLVELASHGRGLMAVGDSQNVYTCETTARAFVDERGALKHTWEMIGEPTASSPIALGAAGYPYTQRGGLRRLGPTERVELRNSAEILLPEKGSALQSGGIDVGR